MENNTHVNPYVQTLLEKGYTERELRTPAPKQEFPKTVGGRVFNTKAEYDEAMADFLNGL